MKQSVALLAALALALAMALACAHAQTDPNAPRSCLPCRNDTEPVEACQPQDPADCDTGLVVRCGCCDVCVVSIEEGGACTGFVPTNGRCFKPRRCVYNTCTSKDRPDI